MLLLGETMGPMQALGAAVMISALCAFQLKR
jgi:drug/metabolite transporter (DMT)-like permease